MVIGLPGGDSVAATITTESIDSLALTVGKAAIAAFKAGAVVLGVAG